MDMTLDQMKYYFLEWTVIEKNFTQEQFESLTSEQIVSLKKEWLEAMKTAKVIKL